MHWINADVIYVAEKTGEEEIPRMLEHTRIVLFETFYQHLGGLSTEELVDWYGEAFRAHRTGPAPRGYFSVWEENERYVMEFDKDPSLIPEHYFARVRKEERPLAV